MKNLSLNKTESICKENSAVTIYTAQQLSEKQEIYKFRYQVYVEEMAKSLAVADCTENVIYDSLDDESVLLYAHDSTGIIGTVRLTIGKTVDFPHNLVQTFSMNKFDALLNSPSDNFCLSTKLAIKRSYRNSQLLYMFIVEAYKVYRDHNAKFNFGGCNPYLIPLYEQMGFRRFTHNFVDPGYGLLVPITMVVEDIEHFRTVRSPFYRIARKLTNDPTIGQNFTRAFPETLSHINSQLISKIDLWELITHKLGHSPLTAMPILRGVQEKEALVLLHFGVIFHCEQNDCIINSGEISNELYILLSGTVEVQIKKQKKKLKPGHYFGGISLFGPQPQYETVTATARSEILVIALQYLEKFKRLYPDAYLQILQNFTSSVD